LKEIISNDNGLREYQINIKNEIFTAWQNNFRRVMLQMPTGTGKTKVFSSVIWDYLRNFKNNNDNYISSKILVIAHRRELLDQIASHLEQNGITNYGFIDGDVIHRNRSDRHYIVQLANNNSLRNFDDERRDFGNSLVKLKFDDIKLIIIDEAHHALADTYSQVINKCTNANVLGVTATPCRMNGATFKDLFDKLIESNKHDFYVKNGFLKPLKFYSYSPFVKYNIDDISKNSYGEYDERELENKYVNRNDVLADVVSAYKKHVFGKKGIVFCVSIAHCHKVVEKYRMNDIQADVISSETSKSERDDLVSKFKSGDIKILCNVDIFSEGFDCPDIDFVQIARPTLSLSKYLQMVGRATRFFPGKVGYVLDNAGLYYHFGSYKQDWNWKGWFEGEFQNASFPFEKGSEVTSEIEELESVVYDEIDELLLEVESDDIPEIDNINEVDFLSLEFYHFLSDDLVKKYFELQNWLRQHFEDQGYVESEQLRTELINNPMISLCDLYGEYVLKFQRLYEEYNLLRIKYFVLEKKIKEKEQEIFAKESIEKANLFDIEINRLEEILPEKVLKYIQAFRLLQEVDDDFLGQQESLLLSLFKKYPQEMGEADARWNASNKEVIELKKEIEEQLEQIQELKLKLIHIYENCQYNNSDQKKISSDDIIESVNDFEIINKELDSKEYGEDEIVGKPKEVVTVFRPLLHNKLYLNEIQPDEILSSIYNEFIKLEIPNLIAFQNGLVWSSTQKLEAAINEINRKVEILNTYFISKNVRFFVCFKNLIFFIKNDIRQAKTYRFILRNSDLTKILNVGSLSDYKLRNEIIQQVFWDHVTNELPIETIYKGLKNYVPHLKMANESSLLTWLKSQDYLYEILPAKMIRKLR
jgi:superfamily II DNA or RNA helicase